MTTAKFENPNFSSEASAITAVWSHLDCIYSEGGNLLERAQSEMEAIEGALLSGIQIDAACLLNRLRRAMRDVQTSTAHLDALTESLGEAAMSAGSPLLTDP